MNQSIGVHLHVHGHDSRLDGLNSTDQLAERAAELGMPALALTDHGVMSGIPRFVESCEKYNIKPIPGCEIYTTYDYTMKGPETLAKRDELIEKYKLYNFKGNGKARAADMNTFMTLARRNHYNPELLKEDAFELLKDSFMSGELEGDPDEVSLSLISDVYSIMKYRNFHMVVIAYTNEGFVNLSFMNTESHLEGFYSDPRIDLKTIRENGWGKGLIATTACLGSYFAQCILAGDEEEAKRYVREMQETFDYVYLEKQATRLEEQIYLNSRIDVISEEMGIKKILTTDVHYSRKEEIELHDMIVASAMDKCVTDVNRLKYDEEFWLKSDEEMIEYSGDEESWRNTMEIANLVNIDFSAEPILPHYLDETGVRPEDTDQLIREMSIKGLINRMKQEYFDLDKYMERLNYELGIINQMGFSDYFLIVQDYVNESLRAGYPVGPGRGSAAGSLVCYALGITQIDPVKYDLIFERFLNPERIGLPDIDVDFTEEGGQHVFEHLEKRYGRGRVSQIGTLTTFGGKSVCKHVGKTLGYTIPQQEAFAKEINESSLDKSLKENPNLQKYIDQYPKWWSFMKRIEGNIKSVGVHAGGVIISRDHIANHIPLRLGKGDKPTSQYDKDIVERYLIKFDVLKLKTLEIVYLTMKIADIQDKVDINKLNVEDSAVYKNIYQKKLLYGVFQVESEGMQKTIDEIRPSNFGDLSSIVALYRPGPMDNIPVYARRKHKREAISYPDDRLKDILEETYGVWVYQEQIMHASTVIGGFSQGHADILRKAIGSKKMDLIEEWVGYMINGSQEHGIEGGIARGFDPKMLERLQKEWIAFGDYAFNKSHSDAYAYLSFVTAWLKYYYPGEFMAALLTVRNNKKDDDGDHETKKYIDEIKKMGFEIKGPLLNVSTDTWSVVNYQNKNQNGSIGELRQSLLAVSGITENNYKDILKMDLSNLKSIEDLLNRIEHYKVNGFYVFPESIAPKEEKRNQEDPLFLDYLKEEIMKGYFDKINPNREEVWEEFKHCHTDEKEGVLLYSPNRRRRRIGLGKVGIIGLIKSGALNMISEDRVKLLRDYVELSNVDNVEIPKSMTKEVIIEFEQESLGSVISVDIRFDQIEDDAVTNWTGYVENLDSWTAKSSGKKHYTFTMNSKGERVSCLVWGFKYENYKGIIKDGNRISARLKKSKDKMILESAKQAVMP